MSFRSARLPALAAVVAAAPHLALAQREQPEEIVVTADFRESRIEERPLSVSVLDRAELQAATQQHFEEAIRMVPNLNLSGEGSRARYFQLRGVGELEQYDGAPNPSVGFIVDDIDFSGLGSVGTLFDIDRVEVLRGPQGTRYGANALGGLVYMRSRAPSTELTADVEATAGSDGTDALGAAFGGPIGDALGFRTSVQTYENNGFRDNVFLGRDDTYGRDELTARGKLVWSPRDGVQVDFTGMYVDVDNGYDAWAIDNVGDRQRLQHLFGQAGPRCAAVSGRLRARASRARSSGPRQHHGLRRHRCGVQLRCRLGQRAVLGAVRV
jgi:outer membrane receptor protein involved in Fe transport